MGRDPVTARPGDLRGPVSGADVVVATTVAAYKANAGEEAHWLDNAAGMIDDARGHEFALSFFVAIEAPNDDLIGFERLTALLDQWPFRSTRWRFSIDTNETMLTTSNRLVRICTGRNLAHEFAVRAGASHILFVDSDIRPPGHIVSKLLEVDWPIVGAEVPTYCLSGPKLGQYPFPVQEHWNTAGALLITRDVFRRVRWRWDPDAGMTDDPCFAADVEDAGFGKTRVRKDVICQHFPQAIGPLEGRGQDLRIEA